MNQYDLQFKQNLSEILKQEWEVDNRAKWKDGSQVMTKRIIGVVNEYDLSKEFPASTLRKVPLKTCFNEIDWIYRQRSNKISDLKSGIWDSWKNEHGIIGRGYGYQINKTTFGYPSQIDYILGELKKNPTSRRLVIEMWNVDDLTQMTLPPCLHNLHFIVKDSKLNLIMKQRSNDMLVANNFNVVEYSLLVHKIARHIGLGVGKLTHVIGDMHIYNKHEGQALELMDREIHHAPTLWINPNINDFYEFEAEDFELMNYEYNEPQLKFEVAI